MTRLLIVLLVLGSQLMLMSCASQPVALSPLTEIERQGLETIGIAAEVSRLETLYSRDASIIDHGLRAIGDRVDAFGEGALEGIKKVEDFKEVKSIKCRNMDCLLVVAFIPAEVLARGVAGGVVGALNGKKYPTPSMMEIPERAAIQAVQESIDAVGLPARLRDHVWERVQAYPAYHFERLSELPADPPKTQGDYRIREIGARYWPLRDQRIQTLLKVRIPLIEFRGSDPDDSFRVFVHVETTVLSTADQSCIRHQTWEYRGESHPIGEWRKDNAKLLIDELDRGLPLIAQRVTQAFFERPSWFSFGVSTPVTLNSESLTCRG